MKKIATLSLAAAAALTLSACGGGNDGNAGASIENETILNSEDVGTDNFTAEDTALLGNGSTTDNLTADTLNGTAADSSIANDTTTNTVD